MYINILIQHDKNFSKGRNDIKDFKEIFYNGRQNIN